MEKARPEESAYPQLGAKRVSCWEVVHAEVQGEEPKLVLGDVSRRIRRRSPRSDVGEVAGHAFRSGPAGAHNQTC